MIPFVFIVILSSALAQDPNCDYSQDVAVGRIYYVYSPSYPRNYKPGVQCRWIATCPKGYNCRLECSEVALPESKSCSMDRLLISRTGDPQLSSAETYCGRGSVRAVSKAQRISIGLITSRYSPGGRFTCELTAQVAASLPSTCRCGEKKQNRIVGGQETQVNEYPMMAGLVDVRIKQIKCGAVIISEKYLLTAAHCLQNQDINDFAVVVGEHDVTKGESNGTRAYRIQSINIHPQFSESNYDYDIALVKTVLPIKFNAYVSPVCLPFKYVNANITGSNVTLLGWGTLFIGGPTSNTLQKVNVKVISNSECRNNVPTVTDRQICTYTPGKDSCQDDSGGPVLYTDPATGLLFSFGIISSGRACASGFPGVNTRVTEFLQWVVANTRADFCIK